MKNPIFLLLISFVFVQCNQEAPIIAPPETNLDCATTPAACDLIPSNNQFGFKVFKKLHEESPDENIFISPTSIATALSMTLNGAAENTKTQMISTLELNDFSIEEVNEAYRLMLPAIQALDEEVILQIANSIWHHDEYPVLQEFLDINEKNFDSEVQELDFFEAGAKDRINDWVKDKTNNLIDGIIDQISDDDIMFLINAIYFKGNWTNPFDPEQTRKRDFFVDENTVEEVDMMMRERHLVPYMETEKFGMIDLPYGDSVYSMSVLIPNFDYNVDDIIQDLNQENWESWTQQLSDVELNLGLPKFKMEYKKELKEVLFALGMEDLFLNKADLSLLGPGPLKVSSVKHKSFIEVDEEGTEAAAVTSVTVVVESAVPLMIADKPFLFVIRENKGGSMLFVGKYMKAEE